jgi:hypothetical protein
MSDVKKIRNKQKQKSKRSHGGNGIGGGGGPVFIIFFVKSINYYFYL